MCALQGAYYQVALCYGLGHPNVMPLKGTFTIEDLRGFSMVFPLMGLGSVSKVIDDQPPEFTGPRFQEKVNFWVSRPLSYLDNARFAYYPMNSSIKWLWVLPTCTSTILSMEICVR